MITPALSSEREETKQTSREESITAWALAARGGDPDAVERFVHALHRDVRRYVTFLGADPQSADDLTQDTFLRALGSLHRFEGRSSARTWLLSIARRAVIDNIRHSASRPRLSDTDDWQSAVERTQPRDLPGFDDGIALAELLDTLPDDRREAFVLTQLVGLPYALAAGVSDCPVGTVRSRVARARTSLIEWLDDAERCARVDANREPENRETGAPAMAEKTYTVSGMSRCHCAAA
ncbi:sigma-70 family RNA polymerase sigma factor [Streptomyces sp. GESEQ-35]|uniref:sigma-70 family RNA polymerase sigma factor n=1 Tax=Streptomyces sp. GESEQ-35 TaxID=2812657 RepID=UPI001B31B164|nr:sigma-70 family RNA polymerase sigma factor [Streptomyces sp. GESEQ-35]